MKQTLSKTFAAIAKETGTSLNNAPDAAPARKATDGQVQNIPAEIKQLFQEIGQSINAVVTTQDADKVLGEPWLSQLKEIHGQINASLKDMPDTERVPAAQEAFYTLGYLKSQFLYIQNTIQNLIGSIKAKGVETAQALASVTKEIEGGIQAKINSGELVEKNKVGDLVTQARRDGLSEGLNQGRLRFDRLMALNSAKLAPEVIATIPESILLGDEAAFNGAKAAAIQRVEKLSGVGLTVASMKNLPWEKPEIFDAQFATYTEIHNNAKQSTVPEKGQSNNSDRTQEGSRPQGHPKPSGLIGGGQSAPKDEGPMPAISLLC